MTADEPEPTKGTTTMSTRTNQEPATVPTVHVRKFGTEQRVVIARAGEPRHIVLRTNESLVGGAATRLAADIRGALADAYLAGWADRTAAFHACQPDDSPATAPGLTAAQELALVLLCQTRQVEFRAEDFTNRDLPEGWVAGYIRGEYFTLDTDGIIR